MANGKRLSIEIVGVLLLALIGAGLWWLFQWRCERRLAELGDRQQSAVSQMRQESEARAERLARSEAEAVFRAFAAGIQGSVLGQQQGVLEMAKGSLLRLPYVAFVHVLAPDGRVLMTSDGKYAVAGRADARAAWALQASELQMRPGDLPGTLEIAAPFQGASGRVAVLWLGYKTQELLAASRRGAAAGG
jgi:hypothetical protein